MKLTYIREVPLLRANMLLYQEKGKKGYTSVQDEINKLSEYFGPDFEKRLYKSIFDEIDFKDLKSLQNEKNPRIVYFFQEFPVLLYRPNFISFFSEILMTTETTSSVEEILSCLNRVLQLSYEHQFKILLSFLLSSVDRFVSDSKSILLSKCKELEKEGKVDQLTKDTVQSLLLILGSFDDIQMFQTVLSNQQGNKEEAKNDLEKLLEIEVDDNIEVEKLILDLKPGNVEYIFNDISNENFDYEIDEKRLADFILNLLNNTNVNTNKENQFIFNTFIASLEKSIKLVNYESEFDLKGFYLLYKHKIDVLDIRKIFQCFDDASFSVKTRTQFDHFIYILSTLNLLQNEVFFDFILTKWDNELNQIEFLSLLVAVPPSINFSFAKYHGKRVIQDVDINQQLFKSGNAYLVEPWKIIDFVSVLLDLSTGNYYNKVKEIFNWPLKNIPELLGNSLIEIQPYPEQFLYTELMQEELSLFLNNHMNSFAVVESVWNTDKNLVIKTICNMYHSSPDLMNLSKILDITQKLKDSLLYLINCDDYKFAVHLAILAVKRDFLNISQWLKDRILTVGDDFIEALLKYISSNLIVHCKVNETIKGSILEKSQLSLESLAVIFENLMNTSNASNPKLSGKMENQIREVYNKIFEIFEELHLQPANSEEIEEIANNTYQQMFRGECTVPETIEKLKKYMNSSELKEKEIYSCIVHCLLDEYRFFHQYPEKQLNTISTFFGQIIRNKLVDGMIETIALKYVMESIKKGSGQMFVFGTVALMQFVDKLYLYPTYLKALRELKQLKNSPAIYEKVHEKYEGEKSDDDMEDIKDNETNMSDTIISNFPPNYQPNIPFQPPHSPIKSTNNNMSNFEPVSSNINEYMQQMNQFPLQTNPAAEPCVQTKPEVLKQSAPQISSVNSSYSPKPSQPQNNFFPLMMNINLPNEDSKAFAQGYQPSTFEQSSSPKSSNVSKRKSSSKSSKKNKAKYSKPMSASSNANEKTLNEQEKVAKPSEEVVGKMKFIFNSMNKSNVPEKAIELKNYLNNDDNIIKWFSYFFVVNRVAVESNNHQTYNELIALIDNKELKRLLIKDTIHYIQKLLASENLEKDLKEKNILKNLGSWLGRMTLGRNKPILAKDLDLKEILLDAYQSGKLSPIVTCISKMLEHAAGSKVFHGKNPWMHALLSILAELNSNPLLKPNLTFEIENLFKKLDLDLKTYPHGHILENLVIPVNSPDFISSSQSEYSLDKKGHFSDSVQSNGQLTIQELNLRILGLDNYLLEVMASLNSSGNMYINKQDLSLMLAQILYASIEQIINPVIERAVNISLLTTKELVIKDFIFEMNIEKFNEAALNCIKALAGSLALVTCKEPLRIEYNNRLKELLQKKKVNDDSIDSILCHHNSELLDIGCMYIHNYVIKKAIEKIQKDSIMVAEIERRKKEIKKENFDGILDKAYCLPDLIRPNINGLTERQYNIYNNYKKMYELYSKIEQIPQTSIINLMIKLLKEPIENSSQNLNVNRMIKNYECCMINIQNIFHDNKSINIKELNEDLEKIEKSIFDYKDVVLKVAKELVKITFKYLLNSIKKKNDILISIYTALITGWLKIQPTMLNEITNFLFIITNIKSKLNSELHLNLLNKNVISIEEYENNLFNFLCSPLTRKHTLKLIKEVKEKLQYKKIKHFMLNEGFCESYFNLFSKANLLPSNLNSKKENITDYKICNIINNNKYFYFKDMCSFAYDKLAETIHPFQTKNFEKSQQKLSTFLSSPFITNNEQNIAFFMIITEFCITKLVEDKKNKDNYSPDDEAKVIYTILSVAPKSVDKLKIFSNFLFGIFRTLHYDYIKSEKNFNQRPYYKLLINFIYLLSKHKNNEYIFNGEYPKISYLMAFSDFLRIIHPKSYPGFAISWLDILSCKYLVSSFLEIEPNSKIKDNIHKYEKYLYLIIDLLTYISNLSNDSLCDYNIKYFIEKVYKFFFILCYSFPEFISNYYFYLLMTIPHGDNYMQLKNLILSCGPKEIEKPNPFLEETKNNQEKRKYAVILFDIANVLQEHGFKALINEYVETKNKQIIDKIVNQLNSNKSKDANYFAINAIVVYWSQKLLKHVQEKKMKPNDITDFYIKLMKNLEPENRDHLINAMLNELRFPSIQTLFFSDLIVFILREIKVEIIEEHIIKNMCERMVYKPIPWGLSLTFTQIMKNQNYKIKDTKFYDNTDCMNMICKIYDNAKKDNFNNFI